jgi:two-component system response regulator PilR (NtrC family)
MLSLLKPRKRVLVLDDDASMRKLVSLMLKRAGYRVDVVTKGNEAIKAIESQDYAAILLDLMMPHEGGMTVMNHLRAEKPELMGRVILVTAAPDTMLVSLRNGIFGVVKKPLDAAELTATVKKLTD